MKPAKPVDGFLDVSTRGKRRKAVARVVGMLKDVREAEELFMSRVPPNLQGGDAYAAADESVDAIVDAVSSLTDAYWP